MWIRRILGARGLSTLAFALAMALPGCGSGGGGGSQETNPDGSVKVAPPTNPPPGSVMPDQEYGPNDPRSKAKAK